MSEEKPIDLTQRRKEFLTKFHSGNINYYRELKKRLGDMFTKKQQAYLTRLEESAKKDNVEI